MKTKQRSQTLASALEAVGGGTIPQIVVSKYIPPDPPFQPEASWELETEVDAIIPSLLTDAEIFWTYDGSYHHQADHIRYYSSAFTTPVTLQPQAPTSASRRTEGPTWIIPAYADLTKLADDDNPWVPVEAFSKIGNDAFREWKHSPRFQLGGDFSLVNFLLELKDMRGFLKGIAHYWRELRRFVGYFSHSESIADGLRALARGELSINFGVLPFLRDIGRMFDRLIGFTRLWRDFTTWNGAYQTVTLVRRSVDLASLNRDSAFSCQAYTGQAYPGNTRLRVLSAEYCAYIAYSYNAEDLHARFAPLRGLLDAAGVRMDASIVWEALPFSFVVDWFLNTDEVLRDLKRDNIPVTVTLHECSHHIKVRRHALHYCNDDESQSWSETMDTFSRRAFVPHDRDMPPIFKEVGIREMLLGTALITVASSPKGYPSVLQ